MFGDLFVETYEMDMNVWSFFILADNAFIGKVKRQSTVVRDQAKRDKGLTKGRGFDGHPFAHCTNVQS